MNYRSKSHPELAKYLKMVECGNCTHLEFCNKAIDVRINNRNDFYHRMGAMNGVIWVLMFLVIYIILMKLMWVIPFLLGVVILTMFNVFPFRRNMMKDLILKLTGIKVINMKLQALAKYLNVDFAHVPEHYKCEKNND